MKNKASEQIDKEMNLEIEKRLHRVTIKLDKNNIKCPKSKICIEAENCGRCNEFYTKCSKYNFE